VFGATVSGLPGSPQAGELSRLVHARTKTCVLIICAPHLQQIHQDVAADLRRAVSPVHAVQHRGRRAAAEPGAGLEVRAGPAFRGGGSFAASGSATPVMLMI